VAICYSSISQPVIMSSNKLLYILIQIHLYTIIIVQCVVITVRSCTGLFHYLISLCCSFFVKSLVSQYCSYLFIFIIQWAFSEEPFYWNFTCTTFLLFLISKMLICCICLWTLMQITRNCIKIDQKWSKRLTVLITLLANQPTNPMELSPSGEANSRSASQEIPCLL